MQDKIIITAAVTGAVHIPTMSEYLPITPDEIAADAVNAHREGAAIAHIHVRDPQNGRPVSDPALFQEVHEKIKKLDVKTASVIGALKKLPFSYSMKPFAMASIKST